MTSAPAASGQGPAGRREGDEGTALFELVGVGLVRGGRPVLSGLSTSLPRGASCLAGPSGSGKSTLLRLLNRLADPDSGRVLYRGADVRDRDVLELRREVALVPQLPALLEGSVAANLVYAGALAASEPDVERLLDLAGLDPSYAERDVTRLSVGEQQRAMLARALAGEPRVLLLDEPTSALDPAARAAVEATLIDLRARVDVSTVLVTHDLDQARRLSSWVVRVEDGAAADQGPTDRLLGGGG